MSVALPDEGRRAREQLDKNNKTYSNRPLKPSPENGTGIVHIVQCGSMKEEAEGIADYVLKRIEEDGVKAGEVLILAPRRQMGHAVRLVLFPRTWTSARRSRSETQDR
jgi:hypothetical protein